MSTGYRSVAWLCDAEWLNVYNKLFSASSENQQKALDIISVWRSRFGSKVPVAIEATYRLFEAHLACEHISPSCSQQVLSCAIIQFIGLIAEKHVRVSKKPIHVVAAELGIPEWITDIRHYSTHNRLQSLDMCKNAVDFAINWIKESHWDAQYEVMAANQSVTEKLEDDNDQIDVFGSCKSHPLFSEIKENLRQYIKLSSDIESKPALLEMVKSTYEMLKTNESFVHVFCSCLINCGFIYYTKDTHKGQKEEKASLFWKPMLMQISNSGFLCVFLHCLISQRCETDDLEEIEILTKYADFCVEKLKSDNPKNLLRKKGSLKVWKRIVRLLLLNNNEITLSVYGKLRLPFLKSVLGEQAFKEIDELQRINGLQADGEQQDAPALSSENEAGCDLLEDMSSETWTSAVLKDSTKIAGSKWMVYEGKMLQNCNIGLLPNQDINSLSKSFFGYDASDSKVEEFNCIEMDDSPAIDSKSLLDLTSIQKKKALSSVLNKNEF